MKIRKVLGVVWGSEVVTKAWTASLVASLRAAKGGEIPEYSNLVKDARKEVVDRMVANAKQLGGNGIVGMRLLTTSVKSNMIEFVAYGTAVMVE